MGYCKLTGVNLDGTQECPIKKMCLNCIDCIENEDGTFACKNEKVLENGKAKMLAALPEGFEVDTLTLKPMALKAPMKKCPHYSANKDLILFEIKDIFSL